MSLTTTPYWWDECHQPLIPETEIPDTTDVLIVGSGYTGLNAALQIARDGHCCLVVDREHAGWGCSSRNGGQISTCIKPDFSTLVNRYGETRAFAILQEGHKSLSWIGRFIQQEALDCDFEVCGRFHAAHNSRALRRLKVALTNPVDGLEDGAEIVEPGQQHRFLGTKTYHGGVFYPQYASLHPARYHSALLQRVIQAGAQIVANCRVETVKPEQNGYRVNTSSGEVFTRKMVIASNGYSGKLFPWLKRRVIPIGSYMMATDEISSTLMDRLMPLNCMVSDTRKVVYYYRSSVDRKRILFGGRVSGGEIADHLSAPLLKHELNTIFPDLKAIPVTHAWHGFVAYTFDELPHIGRKEGIYYALGYCGSGVGMASYLGMRLGQQILEKEQGRTAFDEIGFPTRPLYTGKPWFLAPSVSYYRWRDRLNI